MIRWAEPGDVAALTPLMLQLYAHSQTDPGGAASPADAAAHVQTLLEPHTPHRLAVAFAPDGSAIGLAAAALFVSVNEARPDHRTQMELKELFVAPSLRGQKIGAALMAWLEDYGRAAGVSRFDWHVHAGNARGIAFYERQGAHLVPDRHSMRKLLK